MKDGLAPAGREGNLMNILAEWSAKTQSIIGRPPTSGDGICDRHSEYNLRQAAASAVWGAGTSRDSREMNRLDSPDHIGRSSAPQPDHGCGNGMQAKSVNESVVLLGADGGVSRGISRSLTVPRSSLRKSVGDKKTFADGCYRRRIEFWPSRSRDMKDDKLRGQMLLMPSATFN